MKRNHVVNIEEAKSDEVHNGGFQHRTRRLGAAAGSKGLGCTYVEVEPGKTGFPNHWHSAFEEALYILEGHGSLRIGNDTIEVGPGDYVALLPGPDGSHSMTNAGGVVLRYLALSGSATPATMDIVGYPDSKKLSFASGVQPGQQAWRDGAWVLKLIKEDQPKVDYYDGEPLAER